MRSFTIRSRGQSALFAGVWLALFLPFFTIGALNSAGYATASEAAYRAQSYAPILQWMAAHTPMTIAYSAVELLPFCMILALPYTLRRVVYGEGGRVGQYLGLAGIAVYIIVTVVNLTLLLTTLAQFGSADAATRAAIGVNFRYIALGESMVTSILGGGLIVAWLWSLNFPLARLPGLERVAGITGLLAAAFFAASAALLLYDPRQSHQTISGLALLSFGAWLGITGYLLIQRAGSLGEEADSREGAAPAA